MIGGERVGPVLVDVTPYTFGTSVLAELDGEVYPFVFHPLIPRNTAIPVSRSEVFYTAVDDQEIVEVNVYQGENRDAAENIRVGQFRVEDLSPVPAGNEIVLRFDLTIDGILKVTASEKRTGKHKHLTIESALSRFDTEGLGAAKERLAGLWEGERDEDASGASDEQVSPLSADDAEGRHETVRARAVMEKARGMMTSIPEDDVDTVVELIERIEEALASGVREEAREAVDELSDILFYLE